MSAGTRIDGKGVRGKSERLELEGNRVCPQHILWAF